MTGVWRIPIYYRVSTDHQGVNGNGTLSARRSRII